MNDFNGCIIATIDGNLGEIIETCINAKGRFEFIVNFGRDIQILTTENFIYVGQL